MRRLVLFAALAGLIAAPAAAQERDPAARQALTDLAYVLGQSHALTQLCAPGDQHWRSRMMGMVETEEADHAFAERLRSQFNAGFLSSQSQYPACSPDSRQALSRVAAKGQALSQRLAQAHTNPPAPDSLAPSRGPG